jgi:hypothetical protein
MNTVTLEINTTGSTYVDITDYCLSLSDFYQMFTNYDTTLREIDLTVILSSTILTDYESLIISNTKLRLKQDNCIIFIGYISTVLIDDYEKYEIEIKALHILEKLNVKVLEATYKTGIEANTTVTPVVQCTIGTGNTLDYKGYNTIEMMCYIFEILTGFELTTNLTDIYLNGTLLSEPFWNYGSGKSSADPSLRVEKDIKTWTDFFNYILKGFFTIVWNATTENFSLVIIDDSGTPTLYTEPTNAYEFSTEILDLNKVITWSYTVNNPPNKYFTTSNLWDYKDDPVNFEFSAGNIVNSGTENLDDGMHVIYANNGLPTSGVTGSFLNSFRFYGEYINNVYLINFTDVFLTGDLFYQNIGDIEAKFKDGRYFTEITLITRKV